MFDIGFWELALLGLVALLVVGPERLPGMARTLGKWLGRGRRVLNNLKADIDREIRADEMKKIVEEQRERNILQQTLGQAYDDIRQTGAETGKVAAEAANGFRGEKREKARHKSEEADDD